MRLWIRTGEWDCGLELGNGNGTVDWDCGQGLGNGTLD